MRDFQKPSIPVCAFNLLFFVFVFYASFSICQAVSPVPQEPIPITPEVPVIPEEPTEPSIPEIDTDPTTPEIEDVSASQSSSQSKDFTPDWEDDLKDPPNDTCQEYLEEHGISPDTIVWYALNPAGELVPINAEQACRLCIVDKSAEDWVCSPVDPENPGGGGSGGGGGTDGGGGSGGGGTDGGGGQCGDLENALTGCGGGTDGGGGGSGGGGTDGGGGSGGGGTDGSGGSGGGGTDGGGGSGGGGTDGSGGSGGGGTDGSGGSGGGGTDGGGGGSGGNEIDHLVDAAKSVDKYSGLKFPNYSREGAIKLIRNWFLPRNVDAQPRAFTSYGTQLFHSIPREQCAQLKKQSSSWVGAVINREGEGEENLVWNDYTSVSSGIVTGTCMKTEENRYGFFLHVGKTMIDHESPSDGEYDSDNFGGGVFYLDINDDNQIMVNMMAMYHVGEQKRYHTHFGVDTVTSQGDRNAFSALVNLSYTGTDEDALLQPFAIATLNYVNQEGFEEDGFPFYVLKFESRNTWWLNMEGGLRWQRTFETDGGVDYRFKLAGLLQYLLNISDEKQYFTYIWGDRLGIGSKGDGELGAGVKFGLARIPADPGDMRIELDGSVGYQSDEMSYTVLLNFVFPWE